MKNKFPGACPCGAKVAKGRGELDMVVGRWVVRCPACLADPAAPAPAAPARKRRRSASKALGVGGEAFAKRRPADGKRGRLAKAPGKGVRKRAGKARGKRAGKEWIGRGGASETIDIVLTHNDIEHTAWVDLPDGSRLPCSAAYAGVHADRLRAAAAGDRPKDFDLSVALAELAIYGHAGVPAAPGMATVAAGDMAG